MKIAGALCLFAASAVASPLKRQMMPAMDSMSNVSDTTILNYALTLEHLEAAFYSQALGNFTEADFVEAGYGYDDIVRFALIAEQEATHVQFLRSALGDQAVDACQYNFPYTDPRSFANLASIIEAVGVAAYHGAAPYIQDPSYLSAALSIHSVEAQHTAYIRETQGEIPFPVAFNSPLGLNQVYTIAAGFITSCPDSNAMLPVTAFPGLVFAGNSSSLMPGNQIKLMPSGNATQNMASDSDYFVAFTNGTSFAYAPYTMSNMSVMIPDGVYGQVYAILTNSQSVSDNSTVAGPAVLEIPNPYVYPLADSNIEQVVSAYETVTAPSATDTMMSSMNGPAAAATKLTGMTGATTMSPATMASGMTMASPSTMAAPVSSAAMNSAMTNSPVMSGSMAATMAAGSATMAANSATMAAGSATMAAGSAASAVSSAV